MDDASCGYCGELRALLHCAQHAARLCLPCDVTVHAASRSHERAPLCDGCHAAPAATRCIDHEAALCTACATAASCDAERHRRRPTRTYTGFPEPADLARILSLGTLPPSPLPEPNTWVPDLVNIELPAELSNSAWGNGNTIITEVRSSNLILVFDKLNICILAALKIIL
ncbi:putative zinc finger protein CONSTANS-LIKE 11 [Phragmites australis]|uniref:putative zinc finger protein CONSTANS-LIKE 11 n=1 Tax=Phragmites australis TaxID=29695 RepID=UPI002D7812A2|nr:putative zinc finger protein CONSTANS-LIKE 11 [Phragmites australis]